METNQSDSVVSTGAYSETAKCHSDFRELVDRYQPTKLHYSGDSALTVLHTNTHRRSSSFQLCFGLRLSGSRLSMMLLAKQMQHVPLRSTLNRIPLVYHNL